MPMVNTLHQQLMSEIRSQIHNYIHDRGLPDQIYCGRFGVFFDDYNMVEPDISVICDPNKLTDRGCSGAPDLIIEIASPASSKMDYIKKNVLYLEAGVKEYWIVNPIKEWVTVYRYEEDAAPTNYTFTQPITVGIYKNLTITIADLLN